MIRKVIKKKYVIPLLLILLAILFLLWPHSFPELTVKGEMTLKRVDMPSLTGEDGWTYVSKSSAYPKRTLVQTVMDRYYFRFCPLRTLLANGTMEGNDAGYWIYIYNNDYQLSTGGTGYVMVNNRIYHVGLWGNSENLALMEDLSAVIANEPI